LSLSPAYPFIFVQRGGPDMALLSLFRLFYLAAPFNQSNTINSSHPDLYISLLFLFLITKNKLVGYRPLQQIAQTQMGRKGGRALNPTDAFRKQQRKKELKKVRPLFLTANHPPR